MFLRLFWGLVMLKDFEKVLIDEETLQKRIKELDLILSDFTKFGEEEMRRIESNQPYIKGEKVTRVEKKKKFQWLIDLINKKKNE